MRRRRCEEAESDENVGAKERKTLDVEDEVWKVARGLLDR